MAQLTGINAPQQDLLYGNNIDKFTDTNTGVVRIWADWPTLEPKCEDSLTTPERSSRAQYWKRLDDNIRLAKSRGLFVILSMYRYAPWGSDVTWTEGKWDDKVYQRTIPDRVDSSLESKLNFNDPNWVNVLRNETNNFTRGYKKLEFKMPDHLGPESSWGLFITKLLARYSRFGDLNPDPQNMWVDFFQPVNEPNLEAWPQQAPSDGDSIWDRGFVWIQCRVSQMLHTAKAIRDGFNPATPIILAPDASDTLRSGRLATPCLDVPTGRNNGFTELLLGWLELTGFDSNAVAWSHHNYTDIENENDTRLSADPTNASGKVHRAARVQSVLAEKGWTGFAYNEAPVGPKLYLTEGGCRMPVVNGDQTEQARRLYEGWNRLKNTSLGDGILLFTQFMFHSQANFDSGLCEVDPSLPCRVSYNTWKNQITRT